MRGNMKITNCKVNHLSNPLGYEMDGLRFSWQAEEAEGKKQKEARLRIWQDDDRMRPLQDAPVWDSGWTDLDCRGTKADLVPAAHTRYRWTISVRSDAGEEAVSDENRFETGKGKEAWTAKWIGCAPNGTRHPVFAKQVAPSKRVAAARLYICGLGLYEAYFDGERIGDEWLTPYCNNYNEWVQYQTFDVTGQLQKAGTLSVMLGNGWYKGRFGFADADGLPYYGKDFKLIAELRLVYEDGSREIVGTDESWQVAYSTIVFSNIYDGEKADDTLEETPARRAVLTQPPQGVLTGRRSLPVRIQEQMPAAKLLHTPAGETVVDLGQNITGSFRLRVHEPKGTKIRIQVGEVLQKGNFYRDNLRSALAEYIYISDGKEHVIGPHFTFYGYRYAKVEGVCELRAEDFTGLAMYSDLQRTGTLQTGNGLVNRLILNTEWGQKDNFLDVPTDCPQRDERMGWTGDAEVFSPTACYQMDSYAFFAKYLYDMATEQKNLEGAAPNVVPSFGYTDIACAWGDAACIIPWNLYRFYGDTDILEARFGSMKSWVDHITKLEENGHGWRDHAHYGDWLALDGIGGIDGVMGGTEEGFIALVYLRYSAQLVAKAAAVLGKKEEEEQYTALAERMLDIIRHDYYTPSGRCCIDTQTAHLLSLRHGLTVDREWTAKRLVKKFADNGGKLQTGFVGTPILGEELSKAGHADLAYDLLLNEEYPGWLYEVKLGATTIWERWNSLLPDGSVSSIGMNSFNHYAYGSIVEWLYAYAAGIRQEEGDVGFSRALLAPVPDLRLGSVEASYRSASGLWKSAWKMTDENHIEVCVEVPFGCTARLVLPGASGGVFADTQNPMFAKVEDGVCHLEAGRYSVAYSL